MDKLKSLQSWVRDLKHANEVPIPTYLSHLTTALKLAADQAAEIKRLREALKKYGRHSTPETCCEKSKHSDFKCNCGFDEVLAESEAGDEPTM